MFKESSVELIDFLASKLATKRQYFLELIGHTDKEGTEQFNQELSDQRAKEVAKYFTDYGIEPERIRTKGMGEQQPLISQGTPEQLSKNRRVEIVFVR